MLELFLVAAGGDQTESARKRAKCSGLAYNGGALNVGWGYPVVVDLAGMDIPEKIPLLADHRNQVMSRVGMIGAEVRNHKLYFSGEMVSDSDLAEEIISQATAGGAPWQTSIGVGAKEYRRIEEKETAAANGRNFSGPLTLITKSKLSEISVVPIGADDKTKMAITASFNPGENIMSLIPTPTETAAAPPAVPPSTPSVQAVTPPAVPPSASSVQAAAPPDLSAVASAAVQAALTREQADRAQANTAINALFGSDFPEVRAACLSEGVTLDEAKTRYIAAMRSDRPSLNLMHKKGVDVTSPVIEAAALMGLGMSEDRLLAHKFKPETIDAARQGFRSGLGLQQMLMIQAAAAGCHAPSFNGYEREILRAAFSTNDIGGILSNVANKSLLDAFTHVENTWEKIARTGSVTDFKEVSRFRLTGDLVFQKVGNGGEVKSGSLGEEKYGNRAELFARLLNLTYQDLVNDDLGALNDAAAAVGRGAALGLNLAFWKEFLDNAAFFSAANRNLVDANPLSVDGLTAATVAFRKQTDATGHPLGVSPRFLVVPPALEVTASRLFKDTHVENADAKKTATTGNPHAGKFEPAPSAYLDNAMIPGGSASAWYLLADPASLPAIEVVFRNGQRAPRIETAQLDLSQLGIGMRGVFEFGVRKQDFRAGVKSNA